MKRLALAIVLACAVLGAARAGEIHPTGVVAPPPPPPSTSTATTTGEIHTTDPAEPSSAVLTIILTLISIGR